MQTRKLVVAIAVVAAVLLLVRNLPEAAVNAAPQQPAPAAKTNPTAGHDVHVTAPHVVRGKVMGPYHHYCKPISPEPIIQCLIYLSTDANAPLTQIEYIVAKELTRNTIPRRSWNKHWHDHKLEIASGRVQVHDMPPDEAKKVADLVSTTDGLIFDLWPHGSKIPTGEIAIGQAVSHKPMSEAEFRNYK